MKEQVNAIEPATSYSTSGISLSNSKLTLGRDIYFCLKCSFIYSKSFLWGFFFLRPRLSFQQLLLFMSWQEWWGFGNKLIEEMLPVGAWQDGRAWFFFFLNTKTWRSTLTGRRCCCCCCCSADIKHGGSHQWSDKHKKTTWQKTA